MKKYVELPLAELKEGITILKNHGFMYTIESIERISENIRLVVLSDNKGNTINEYATDDKMYFVREEQIDEDWQKVNRQDKTDGLSQKAVNAYRRENPGSKLKTAVTEKNPKGKRASRRKSFCSRMGGMKKRLTSAKTARDPDSRINKALRRWNCNSSYEPEGTMIRESIIEKLAKKHGVSEDQIEKQLEMGMEVEKEHTDNPKEARKIALDHLKEKPDYYTKLKKYVEDGKDTKKDVSESKLYKRLVSQLKAKGMPDSMAYATATKKMKESGNMPKSGGPEDLTAKGKKRQAMGAAGRAKDRAAKKSGRSPKEYKYNPQTNGATLKSSYEPEGEMLPEENKPTNPSLWSKAKSLAKQKFDVYPSAYANGWAAKYYKSKGGGWKKG
jgi:hypothetical protein